jgi:hypothetical protein
LVPGFLAAAVAVAGSRQVGGDVLLPDVVGDEGVRLQLPHLRLPHPREHDKVPISWISISAETFSDNLYWTKCHPKITCNNHLAMTHGKHLIATSTIFYTWFNTDLIFPWCHLHTHKNTRTATLFFWTHLFQIRHGWQPVNVCTRAFYGYVRSCYRPDTERPGVDVMITIFCDFWQFSAKKSAFFSKTNVMINILHKLALFWVKNSAKIFQKSQHRSLHQTDKIIFSQVPSETNS